MAVQKYTNTTEVLHDLTVAYDEDGLPGAQFNRRNWYAAAPVGGGSTADTGEWRLPSNPCVTPSTIFDDGTGGTQLSTTDYPNILNFYAQDGAIKTNFSNCRDRGWKGLRAEKVWHGAFQMNATAQGILCANPASALLTTKYRTLRRTRKLAWTGDYSFTDTADSSFDLVASASITSDVQSTGTVGRYSGVEEKTERSAAVDSDYTVTTNNASQSDDFILDQLNFPGGPAPVSDSEADWKQDTIDALSAVSRCTVDIPIEEPSFGAATVEISLDSADALEDLKQGIRDFRTVAETSDMVFYEVGSPGAAVFTRWVYDVSITVSAVGYDYSVVATLTEHNATGTTTLNLERVFTSEGSCLFSDAYTLANVQTDLEAARDVWNLASRPTYRWRTDSDYCGFNPLVGYSEQSTPSEPTGSYPSDADWATNYQDGIACGYHKFTGNITGRPLPDGYTRAFNFSIQTYDGTGPSGSGCYGNVIGYGMQSPVVLPQSATLWPENYENWQNNQASCAFALYAAPQGWTRTTVNGITAQIYCEVKEEWPSQNYFRPAGEDRAKTDAAGVSLWPKAWGILGRVAVTVEDIGGGQIKFTLPEAGTSENGLWPSRDLRVGDTVRIFPATIGLSATAPYNTGKLGDVVIDSLDATSITVTATFATYETAKWAMGGHASRNHDELPAYPLDDTAPKGQFVFISQTISDAGASAVTKEQHCLPSAPCSPNVLSIGYANQAVTGKSFAAGYHVAFPAVVAPATYTDTQIWRGAFVQRMPDLLYVDKVDCTGDCTRDGCDEDFCDKDIDADRPTNYPFQVASGFTRNWDANPWVEAMIALPSWDNGGGVTITARPLPTTAAGEIGAGNPKATAVTFPTYALPSACHIGTQMRRYTTTILGVSTYYLDAPWTDTALPYADWP